MKYRTLGNTNYRISSISLGTWQLGSKWGAPFNEEEAFKTLNEAVKNGINFFDTADVYQGGLSEKTIGKFLKTQKKKIYVVTKCGRQLNPHLSKGYTKENLRNFINNSRKNLDVDCLDLILLHCPPSDVYYNPEVFQALDEFKKEGIIKAYGVSVERIEEAIKALQYDISAVEIIFNMFRLRPAELFFELATKRNVGIIVRVPLASGLLTGNYNHDTVFTKDDHRTFNRNGECFDKGETFSGVNYEVALKAVDELKKVFDDELAKYALAWILKFKEVSCIIPGASNSNQVIMNVKALDITIDDQQMLEVERIYNKYIKNPIHYLW